MKTTKLIFNALMLYLISNAAFAQAPGNSSQKILLMSVSFTNVQPGIIITDETNNQQVIKLEKHGIMGISKIDIWEEYTLEVTKQINLIIAKGYKLIGSSGGDAFSNYIFEKQ